MINSNNRERIVSRKLEDFERLRAQLEKAYNDMGATDAQLMEILDSIVELLQTQNWYRNVQESTEDIQQNIVFFNGQSQTALKDEIELLNNVIDNLRDELDEIKNGRRI